MVLTPVERSIAASSLRLRPNGMLGPERESAQALLFLLAAVGLLGVSQLLFHLKLEVV